jgi:hypothetical protein
VLVCCNTGADWGSKQFFEAQRENLGDVDTIIEQSNGSLLCANFLEGLPIIIETWIPADVQILLVSSLGNGLVPQNLFRRVVPVSLLLGH